MTREVDLKALVSHIVKGDGMDRCRICMGDTSQGQVHLGDTVMMDGNYPVTLSELLEIITGVEVEKGDALPTALCRACAEDVISANKFKRLCEESTKQWKEAVDYLSKLPETSKNPEKFFAILQEKQIEINNDDGPVAGYEIGNDLPLKGKRPRMQQFKISCPLCSKKFSLVKNIIIHLKKTNKSACSICGLVMDKANIAKHMNKKHEIAVVDCKKCFELFTNSEDAKLHWMKFHGPFAHSCEICGQGFKNSRGLKVHELYHTVLHCTACGKYFDNKPCFIYHQTQCKLTQEPQFEVYECHECGLQYDKKPSLRIHIIQKHLNVLPFVCQTCGKRASTLPHLRSHQLTHKNERKTWQCHCGRKFKTKHGHRLHLRNHSGVRPYKCELCEESFLCASRRSDHMKRKHKNTQPMAHGCDTCGAKFIRPWELKKHYLNVHSSVVEVLPRKRSLNPSLKRLRTVK